MTISIEIAMIVSVVIAIILTTKFSNIFYGDKKRMGYTYASQIYNSKVVSKITANFFIVVLFVSFFIMNQLFKVQYPPEQNYMDKIMERNNSVARQKNMLYYNY